MSRDPSSDFFREQLLGSEAFEIVGSDRDTGVDYRATVRRGKVDVAAFSRIDSESLRSSIEAEQPLSIGATLYRIDYSFGPMFLRAVRDVARISAISVTIQSSRQVVCFIGRKPSRLADAIDAHLPPDLQWARDTLVKVSRDWGRKVGHAAKDLAGLRESTFSIERLKMLEQSGDAEAYEAVCKEAIWPAPTLATLRAKAIPPTVSFGIVSCWRMLKRRPARNPAFRLAFVRDLPALRRDLEACLTLDDFAEVVSAYVRVLANDAPAVVGRRLRRFAQRVGNRYRAFLARGDTVLRHLLAIDAINNVDAQWTAANQALSKPYEVREYTGSSLPNRRSLPVEQLIRSGPDLPQPPALGRVSSELGITGLELGNYVSRSEGKNLACLLAEAFADLQKLLGNWIVPLCRSGNLSIALGARGKGKSCAHYEPALRVINLTKSRGDGSVAHEFAHFLDHMLAVYVADGESRFLSARVNQIQRNSHPIAVAMGRVMEAISFSRQRERIKGNIKPTRWFLRRWIQAHGYDPELPPQVSFDRIADRERNRFRGGRAPSANCVVLVDSIAKFGNSPVEVEISYDGKSNFLQHAKQLGTYWYRPEELFARAFESFVEDEATSRGWQTEFLVFGTRRDYTSCRALPYPGKAKVRTTCS